MLTWHRDPQSTLRYRATLPDAPYRLECNPFGTSEARYAITIDGKRLPGWYTREAAEQYCEDHHTTRIQRGGTL